MSDSRLRHGSNRCKCTVCGRYFTTDRSFDRHRTGEGVSRVCNDPATLLAKNGDRRFVLNPGGFWMSFVADSKPDHWRAK